MLTRSTAAIAALVVGTVSARTCTNMTIPVTITSRNGVFDNIATPIDNFGATYFALNSTRQGANGTELAMTGYATVSGTYHISAMHCTASNSSTASNATHANSTASSTRNLQILTHGIGFDKTYWDFSYNNYNYSYVNNALAAGYDTLSYDRLGIGNSSHGEPKNEIQSFLEIEGLAAITNMFRNGTLGSYTKVIHVGHSFGSAQTYSLAAKYPNITDGIVLTGFSMNGSFVSIFTAGNAFEQAYLNQPLRFGNISGVQAFNAFTQTYAAFTDLFAPVNFAALPPPLNYPPGYLVNSNAGTTNFLFLYNGFFDPKLLPVAEQGKQPVTVGEALTLSSLTMMNPYTGPVLVFGASNDVPYCGGNCTATGNPMVPSIPSAVSKNFPKAKTFQSYIQPNTGHGIQLHYNSTAGNQYIFNFLKGQGL